MTIEEKAKRYDESLEQLKGLIESTEEGKYAIVKEDIIEIFPELQESEDEKTRKEIIDFLQETIDNVGESPNIWTMNNAKKWIAWLEKLGYKPQGKSALEAIMEEKSPVESLGISPEKYEEIVNECIYGESADKVEQKFHEGDWVVDNECGKVNQITSVRNQGYDFANGDYMSYESAHKELRLWSSIADAKDGDVLATSFGAFIYNGNNGGGACPGSYCGINTLGKFQTGVETHWTCKKVYPATKKQRDLLFQKMKEAGYEWNADKKELRKIAQSELTEFEDAVKDMMNAYRDAIGANDVTTEEIKKHAKYLLSLIPHKPIEQKLSNSEKIGKNEKPMWTDEDEKRLQSCIIELQGKGLMGGVDTIDTKWLKSLKQRMEE